MTPDAELCAEAARLCACFHLRRTARAVTRLYDDALQASGLRSTQFVILVAIQAEGEPTLPKLARILDLDRSVITRNLRPLERDGLLETRAGEAGRATTVGLTEEGLRKLAEAMPLWEVAQQRLAARMGADRMGALLGDLDEVHRVANES